MENSENQIGQRDVMENQMPEYQQKQQESKKRFKWFAFGCLTSIAIAIVTTTVFMIGFSAMRQRKPARISPGTFLHLKLSGSIEEHVEFDQDIFSMSKSASANTIVDKINAATFDPRITGLLLEPRFIMAGYPVLNEILDAIDSFKQTGKKVYAYLEIASNRDYYLAASADEIFIHPSASSGIYLSGVGISTLYMKDLLAKLGVEATVLHSGEYKGAGEEYVRNEMSPQMLETLNTLLDDFYTLTIEKLADMRNLDTQIIRQILEERDDLLINQYYAIESGLVDSMMSLDDLLTFLESNGHSIIKFSSYQAQTTPVSGTDKIAIVYLQGMITMSSSGFDYYNYISASKVKDIVENLEKDKSVKGVVLRINSPGGSALESELIHDHILRLKRTKPVVVSMGATAASGGYYISAPSDYIVADPFTITGSIGVAAIIPNFSKTITSIGAHPQSLSRGKFSNFLNVWEPVQEEDVKSMQRGLDNTYDEFLLRVHQGRNIPMADVEEVAQGKIWTSYRAKDVGLIDDVGSMTSAVNKAAELAGLEEYSTQIHPKTKTFFDLLMERRFDLNVLTGLVTEDIPVSKQFEYVRKLFFSAKTDPIQYLLPVIVID
jgi:protease IV